MGAESSKGNKAFVNILPVSRHELGPMWTNNKMPGPCYKWAVNDKWNVSDFRMYNVTYPDDCRGEPFVICYHIHSNRSLDTVAKEIGRIPAPMRQAASVFMTYSDMLGENPSYDRTNYLVAAVYQDGAIFGRSNGYFPAALVHEVTHLIDGTLASPDAVHPAPGNTQFSSTQKWRDPVNNDGYAISEYGASAGYQEDFADVGRAVLLDTIYPGGLKNLSDNNANLTLITKQLKAFKDQAGTYYRKGGSCNDSLRFRYPTLMDIPKQPEQPAPGLPQYSQCGGKDWTGPTKCATGLVCVYVK
ncbi:hypothetical protein B0H66DRAFT_570386 [Apodospora peruviana]|uniref:CBM1 domain-containing protein n=1 Tax=Apodospora peruviana TaxID=516989 RepID=A0AAE0HSY1_9PEZI|nr:hypothetical protein B0H66DRAFT_570386 [Apodospora peruviana]